MKKIISSLLLFAVLFTAFLPSVHAVQFAGEDITDVDYRRLKLPSVGTKSGTGVYTFDSRMKSNGINSLLCASGESEVDGSCNTYLATVTPFFVYDRTNFQSAKVVYNIGGNTLEFRMFDHLTNSQYEEGYVYFTYESYRGHNRNTGGSMFKIDKNEACGTKNSNICVVGIHTYLYFVSTSGIQGVYLAFADGIKYSGPNDDMVYLRRYYDAGSHFDNRTLYDSLLGFFNKYKGSYGKLLFDFSYDTPIFYMDDPNDGDDNPSNDRFYIYFEKNKTDTGGTFKKRKGEYMQGATKPSVSIGSYFKDEGAGAYALSLASYNAYVNTSTDSTYIRDFFVGGNEDLVFNLKDYFGVLSIDGKYVGTDSSSNPENWSDWQKCENTDLGCHIKILGNIIGGFFSSIGDLLKSIFRPVWDGFLEAVQSVFYWFWSLIDPFITPIINEFKEIYAKVEAFLIEIWELMKGTFNGGSDNTVSFNQQLICKNDLVFNDEKVNTDEGITGFLFSVIKAIFGLFSVLDPLAPSNGVQLCTYEGIKTLHLRENSFVDIIFLMIFSSFSFFIFYRINNI